ncbi:MAG TPA: hypothetical protein VF070_14070 [Streptosporangiaceae bacterium]
MIRILITLALAVTTFTVYYHTVAARVLHEPAIATGISGNALGFMDLAIVWLLLFVVGGESWPITKRTAHRDTGE